DGSTSAPSAGIPPRAPCLRSQPCGVTGAVRDLAADARREARMSKELVISANRHETRVALIEDDQLVEVYFQRANEYSLAGSIHKGRVTRVLPGMQSAFVDLGLERDTFLYVSDFLEEHEDFDKVTGEERPLRQEREHDRDRRSQPPQQHTQAAASPAHEAPPSEGPAAAAAPVVETEYDEPAHYPPENAIPDAPAHEGALAGPVPEIPEPAAEATPPPLPVEEPAEAETAAADSGPAVAPMLDEEEDRDIQAMILGEAEGIEDAGGGGAEPEDWGNGGPATDAIGEEVPAGPDGGTAAVRER